MYHDSENFHALRRLLALKRHEQPPPGYFHNFSRQVIARIEAGEEAQVGWAARWFGEASWLRDLLSALETKPILSGSVGLGTCALLLAGVVYSNNDVPQPEYAPAIAAQVESGESAALAAFQMTNSFGAIPAQSSLFGVSVEPVSFRLPRN